MTLWFYELFCIHKVAGSNSSFEKSHWYLLDFQDFQVPMIFLNYSEIALAISEGKYAMEYFPFCVREGGGGRNSLPRKIAPDLRHGLKATWKDAKEACIPNMGI